MPRFSREENVGREERIEARKPSSKRNTQRDKRNKKKGGSKQPTEKRYSIVGSVVSLAAGQDNPANKLTSDLIGATITITNPHQLVDTNEYPTSRYTLPTTYSTKISNIINETSFELAEPYFVTDRNGNKIPVSLKKATNNASITYDTFQTQTENNVFQRSFANLTVGNLRTFSGDVYKAKVYTRDAHSSTDFQEIFDTFVVPENSLVNNSSINGFENIGFFHTGSIIAENWVSSSTTSNEAATFVSLDNSKLIDGLLISGSTNTLSKKVTFRTKNSVDLEKDVDYVLRFNSYFFKSIGERKDKDDTISTANHASLKIFISGSAITGANGEEDFFLGEVDVPDSAADQGEIKDVIGRFTSAGSGSPKAWIKFELNSGRFVIQDVALEPFNETNFNPSFFKALAPMPGAVRRGDKYDFLVEFYDSNNNLAETTAQVNGITFAGPRQIIADGLDAKLTGSLLIGESVEMYGTNPAFIRSVGYEGFDKTIASGSGGFLLFSGSIGDGAVGGNRLSASEAYEGVGLEIVDAHAATDRFMKFRTNPSTFRVQTDEFFLGSTSQFVSGSQGKIEISSSNFHLQNDGDVVMQGTITAEAGGTIGGFTIGSSSLSVGSVFQLSSSQNTADPASFISSSAFKVSAGGKVTGSQVLFTGGTIGGFTLSSTALTGGSGATTVALTPGTGIHMGNASFASAPFNVSNAGAIQAQKGIIGGFTINSSSIESTDFVSNLRGIRLTTLGNGTLEAENAKIRGTLSTTVFEKETVNAVGGQLLVANSTTITGSLPVSASQVTMSVKNVTGFADDEIIMIKKVSNTGFTTEYIKVNSSSRDFNTSDTNFAGKIMVSRNIASGSNTDSVNVMEFDSGSTAQSYQPGQVLVSTGKIGTGYIRLNANPNDIETPYIDIVERTGSAVYDMDLKVRLGDLGGISDTINGQAVSGFGLYTDNAFLKGGIVASYGSIGAFNISSTGLSSDSGEFQVTGSTGQITGSKVSFTGGKIANFTIDGHSLTTTGVEINDSTQTHFISSSNFKVKHTGEVTGSDVLFTSGKFSGDLDAAGGTFAGQLTIGGSDIDLTSSGLKTALSLNNVDNTSDATKQTATLSAADKDDVGLGNVANKDEQNQAQDGIRSSITLNQGGINLTGGAAVIKSNGKDSVTDTTAGFFLGHDSGSSFDFAVGDGNNNIRFDGSAADLQVTASKFGLDAVSSNVGINMNSLNASIIAQSGSNDTAVKLIGVAGERKGGALQVSQSGIPLIQVGGGETQIFSSLENMSMGSLPIQQEDQVFDVSDDAAVASASTQLGSTIVLLSDRPSFEEVENIQDAVSSTVGIPTVRMATAIVQSHLSASKINAGQSLFLKNTRAGSSKNTKFKVFLDDNKASGSVKNIPVGFDVRKTYGSATAEFGGSDFVHQSFAFNSVHSSSNANVAFKASSNNSGSAIFHVQETLLEGANDKFQDGAFCLMRLDADTSDLQQREHRTEFVFLEMRESTGSSGATTANGPATKNRVFQVQASGSVVANGNITAFGSTFMNVSDERLKENVYDVSGSLNKILELRPTHFTWKENKKQDVGFIAQEVEEIIPEVVETSQGFINTDGEEEGIKDMKTISYPKLIPYLVDTIQELTKRIEKLEEDK